MNLLDYIATRIGVREGIGISDPILCSGEIESFNAKAIALQLSIQYIANLVASAEIRTFENGIAKKGEHYYKYNVQPNRNTTASSFMRKIVRRILIDGECLVVRIGNELFVADHFDKKEYAFVNNQYTNIRIGTKELDRSTDVYYENEVWYFEYNVPELRRAMNQLAGQYEIILDTVAKQYRKKKYVRAVAEMKGIVSQQGEDQAKVQNAFNANMRNFLDAEKDTVLLLGNNRNIGRFESVMGEQQVDDAPNIRGFTDDILNYIGSMFFIPIEALKGQPVDITGHITAFLKPFTDAMAQEINRKDYSKYDYFKNTYCDFDLSKVVPQSILDIAKRQDYMLRSGTHSINDNRAELGLERIKDDWANLHWMTLNYDLVERFVTGEQGSGNKDKGGGAIEES